MGKPASPLECWPQGLSLQRILYRQDSFTAGQQTQGESLPESRFSLFAALKVAGPASSCSSWGGLCCTVPTLIDHASWVEWPSLFVLQAPSWLHASLCTQLWSHSWSGGGGLGLVWVLELMGCRLSKLSALGMCWLVAAIAMVIHPSICSVCLPFSLFSSNISEMLGYLHAGYSHKGNENHWDRSLLFRYSL